MPYRSAETDLLQGAFRVALDAVTPATLLPNALKDLPAHGPALVLGAGKAAAAMASAFASSWDGPIRGLVVAPYEHGLMANEQCGAIEIVEAGHPSPDQASLEAGAKLLALARSLAPKERLHCLISGGGSALAAAPLGDVSFAEKRAAANYLIRSGANIREINCVRKHLSGIKGGRLASAAHRLPVTTYAISDVPGDKVADIASGPSIADETSQRDAVGILEKYAYPETQSLLRLLQDPSFESPKPDDPRFANDDVHLIASGATALNAAAQFLRREGYQVLYLGDDLDHEAQVLGAQHAQLARAELNKGSRIAILSGGETRVVLGDSGGRGGRNLEYLAGLALALNGHHSIYALAADTDGIDGHGGHAGGLVIPSMLDFGAKQGLSLEVKLAEHDSYVFFDACDLLIRTGPTRTNVNDFRLILCHP